jgi:hypothetical protein
LAEGNAETLYAISNAINSITETVPESSETDCVGKYCFSSLLSVSAFPLPVFALCYLSLSFTVSMLAQCSAVNKRKTTLFSFLNEKVHLGHVSKMERLNGRAR